VGNNAYPIEWKYKNENGWHGLFMAGDEEYSISVEYTESYYINEPNDSRWFELDGMVGKCEGYYGMDKSFTIIRLNSPLSSGERSIVIPNSCLEWIKNYQPPTVDFVKKPDKWC